MLSSLTNTLVLSFISPDLFVLNSDSEEPNVATRKTMNTIDRA